jgi:hypothetical protein
LAGTTAGSLYDRLVVTGPTTFAGTLEVALQSNFAPALGNSFDLLDWSSRSGRFQSIRLPSLGTGLAWNLLSFYTTGTISVANSSQLPGDFNRNGRVDKGDVSAMLKALTNLTGYQSDKGITASQLMAIGDLNGSGKIDNRDLQPLLNLVADAESVVVVVPVPEPSNFVAIASACIAMLLARCYRCGGSEFRYSSSRV